MSTGNGHDPLRLDRIEKIIEVVATRQADIEDDFARLLKAQVLMADSLTSLATAQARTDEKLATVATAQAHTDQSLDALIKSAQIFYQPFTTTSR